jgi:hypothetical protein
MYKHIQCTKFVAQSSLQDHNIMLLYFYESESNFICNSIMVGTYKNNIKILTDINIIHLAFSFCSVINYKYSNHNNMHIAYTHNILDTGIIN